MPVSECSINEEEGFLHNHQECIKAQRKGMNSEYFLESIGLGAPLVLLQPKKPESPVKHFEMEEEIPLPFRPQNWKPQFTDYSLPLYDSPPKSIKCMEYELMKDEEYFPDFKLIESPPSKLRNFPIIK